MNEKPPLPTGENFANISFDSIRALLKEKRYEDAVRQAELLLEVFESGSGTQNERSVLKDIRSALTTPERTIPSDEWRELEIAVQNLVAWLKKVILVYKKVSPE